MKDRKPHTLQKTKGDTRPTNVIFFDTETRIEDQIDGDQKHVLKLGHVVFCRTLRGERLKIQRRITFKTPAQFADFVDAACRNRTTIYITAHNISFDIAVVDGFRTLHERGWKMNSFYTKGITSIFRWTKDEKKLIAIDNTNLFPGSLEYWGEIMGIPKLKVDFDNVTDKDLETYCIRDVEIMIKCWLTWMDFLDTNKCGAFKMTVGATALNTWRHRFMPVTVHIHNDPLALMLERQSYRGGRTECLFQGKITGQPFYYIDINAMYGHVLSRYLYPAGISDARETNSLNILIRKLSQFAVVARVTIDIDEPWFPYKTNNRTIYPVGRFTTTLTTPELKLCYQKGWIQGVHALAWYRQAPLFSKYVKHFGALKTLYTHDNNQGYATICKLLINSLYGKFGQSGFEQKQIGETDIDDIWNMTVCDVETGEFYRMIALAGGVFEERKTGESFHSFPAIAAHVTAYARMYLYRLVRRITPGHVYYMDTDSMIVDRIGLNEMDVMLDPDEIGSMKIEHQSEDLSIFAPKDYIMGDRVRLKGIKKDAVMITPGVYKQTHWFHLPGLIRIGSLSGSMTKTIVKHQRRVILSGHRGADGWISPFCLSEQEPLPAFLQSIPLSSER